ncbi:MAG: dethiobiotin synthase [Terrimicrobiaceae bacterium]|nr:dethiobiotin synthase [Terrimicrobiaceae bacterium]
MKPAAFPERALTVLERAFVTGTDTGVGKTFVTARLAAAQRARGLDTLALKPVCCGGREDAEILREACACELALDEVNPVWLPEPLAPAVAARGNPPRLEALEAWFQKLSAGRRSVLVEGAGGWLVPLAPGQTMADLAVRLGLPVVIVVANRLGCLNHALLTLASVRAHGLPCPGFILNATRAAPGDISPASNRQALEDASGLPVLLEFSWEKPAA